MGMTREHLREAVVLAPGRLRALLHPAGAGPPGRARPGPGRRRDPRRGGGRPGTWLRLSAAGAGPRPDRRLRADDIPDPMGSSRRVYERTATEIEDLVDRLVADWPFPVAPLGADPALMRIAIGADHAGYDLKAHLVPCSRHLGHEVSTWAPTARVGRLPGLLRRRGPGRVRGERRAGHRAGRLGPGRADRRQQGAGRAGRAVQRPLHRPHGPPAQRRQRAVPWAGASSAPGLADEIVICFLHRLPGRPPPAPRRPAGRDRPARQRPRRPRRLPRPLVPGHRRPRPVTDPTKETPCPGPPIDDTELFDHHRCRGRPPEHDAPADRLGELHLARR